jgi:hypothetical protein
MKELKREKASSDEMISTHTVPVSGETGSVPAIKIAVMLLIVAAGLMRFYELGSKHLWLDEQITMILANWKVGDIISYLRNNPGQYQQPLYFIICHYLQHLGGVWAVKAFSAAMGTGALVFIYLSARELAGWKAALLTLLMSSVSWFQLYYSQEARMYSFLLLISFASLYFALKIPSRNRKYDVLYITAFTITNIIGLYLHYFYAVFLVSEVSWMVFTCMTYEADERRRFLKQLGISIAITVVIILPWIRDVAGVMGFEKQASAGSNILADDLNKIISDFGDRSGLKTWILMVLFGIGMAASFGNVRKSAFYIVLCALPITFLLIFLRSSSHFFDPRYMIFMHPVFLMAAADGILLVSGIAAGIAGGKRASGPIAVFCALALIIISIGGLKYYYAQDKRPWDQIFPALYDAIEDGDIIIVEPPVCYNEVIYYLDIDQNMKAWLLSDPKIQHEPVQIQIKGKRALIASTATRKAIESYPGMRVWFLLFGDLIPDDAKNFDIVVHKAGLSGNIRLFFFKVRG